MRGFNFSYIKGDVFGGVTAGIVALPLALAFGLQSGLGAAAGLYGAIFISFFGAFFGGTNTQISGPTAPMTAVSMVVISGVVAGFEGNLNEALFSILIIFALAGVIQIVFGLLRFGSYIKFIPYPVVSGFMTGIGVIILITQLPPMLGYYPGEDKEYVSQFVPQAEEVILENILQKEANEEILVLEDFKETVRRSQEITEAQIQTEAATLAATNASGVFGSLKILGRAIRDINWTDFFLCIGTIFIIYGFKRVTRAVPSTLVALVLVTLCAFFFLPDYRTIGQIPSGFPIFYGEIFSEFDFVRIAPYLLSAISLAALGSIDSLLTSVVADNMTKTTHKSNKELVGQGVGNVFSAFFGGIPGAGATIRTVVNIKSGGKTKLSGMMAGVLLLIVLLVLGPLASTIPVAVLAGILVTVGIGVMDYKGLRHLIKLPRGEVLIMLIVLILTVFVGLIEAVAIGLMLAALFFMATISNVTGSRTSTIPLKDFVHEMAWVGEEKVLNQYGEKIYIKHLDGPLFFGFVFCFQAMIKELQPPLEVVIIRMDRVPYMDQSGAYALEGALEDLEQKNIKVVFTDIHGQPEKLLHSLHVIPQKIKPENCFATFKECSEWLQKRLKN